MHLIRIELQSSNIFPLPQGLCTCHIFYLEHFPPLLLYFLILRFQLHVASLKRQPSLSKMRLPCSSGYHTPLFLCLLLGNCNIRIRLANVPGFVFMTCLYPEA